MKFAKRFARELYQPWAEHYASYKARGTREGPSLAQRREGDKLPPCPAPVARTTRAPPSRCGDRHVSVEAGRPRNGARGSWDSRRLGKSQKAPARVTSPVPPPQALKVAIKTGGDGADFLLLVKSELARVSSHYLSTWCAP